MQQYELMYVISGDRSETNVPTMKESVNRLLTDTGASITREEDLGKRRLAYPIRGEQFGYYTVVEFDGDQTQLTLFRSRLHIADGILRHDVVIKPKRHFVERVVRDRAPAAMAESFAPHAASAATAPIAPSEPHQAVDMAALDKKLDELLEKPAA